MAMISGKLVRDTRMIETKNGWEPSPDPGFGTLFLRGEVFTLNENFRDYLTNIGYTVADQVREQEAAMARLTREKKRKDFEEMTGLKNLMEDKQAETEADRQIHLHKKGTR